MLTTIIFAVTYGCSPEPGASAGLVPGQQPGQLSMEKAIFRGVELAASQATLPRSVTSRSNALSFRPFGAGQPFTTSLPQGRSLLRVSEHQTTEVPAGTAAVYYESGRPVDSIEETVLSSMLDALKLSIKPESIDSISSPRAFKVSRVSNEDAVNPKDEAKQAIYASIQSTISGI